MKLLKRISILIILVCFGFITISTANVHAENEEGFGISGSFAGYHYKLVPGETFSSSQISVIFFNNYNFDIEIDITTSSPQGVTLTVDEDRVSIAANQTYEFPIEIETSTDVTPGNFVIGVAGTVVPKEVSGIQIIGSAELSAELSVYGEAGRISIQTETVTGSDFIADLQLYRVEDDGQLSPIGDSDNGAYTDRVVPGKYVAIAYYEGTEINRYEFIVEDEDDLDITLDAQTIFITTFMVGPVINEEEERLISAEIAFNILNIYEELQPSRVMLEVWFEDELIDEMNIVYTDILGVGDTNGRYVYIPSKGWHSGDYSYILKVYEDDTVDQGSEYLHAESDTLTYRVPRNLVDEGLPWYVITGIVIVGLGIIFGIIWFFFIRDDEEEDDKKQAASNPVSPPITNTEDTTKKTTSSMNRVPFPTAMKKASRDIQMNYVEIKKYLLQFPTVKTKVTVSGESYMVHDKVIAKITLVQDSLKIHIRANTKEYSENVYHHKDFGHVKGFSDIPFTLQIRSTESKKNIKKVLNDVMVKTLSPEELLNYKNNQ